MIKVDGIQKIMVLRQAVFLAASPLVRAPPSHLTRLYYNSSDAKSHSTTKQYRQLRRLENKPLQIQAPKLVTQKKNPANCPSNYKPCGGLYLEIALKYKVKQNKKG